MIYALPEASSLTLTDSLQPTGWEHLGGPLSWYKWVYTADNKDFLIEEHEEYGHVVHIKPVGKLGQLARRISDSGVFPVRTVLIAGPPGVGKSALEVLFTRVKLSTKLQPVKAKFYDPQNKDKIIECTFIDSETGRPFNINPEVNVLTKPENIRRWITTSDTKNLSFRFYNAGNLNKAVFDEVLDELRTTRPTGRNWCVIVSEFDNLDKRQLPSLKAGLDPSTVPSHALFMADTNHFEKVRNTIGPAGLERFELVLQVERWSVLDLALAAERYLSALKLPIASDLLSAQTSAHQQIAEGCDGSYRQLLIILDQLRSQDTEITPQILAGVLSSAAVSENASPYGVVIRFAHMVRNKRTSATNLTNFVYGLYRDGIRIIQFSDLLAKELMSNHPNLLNDKAVSESLLALQQISAHDGEPIGHLQWAQSVYHLQVIADKMSVGITQTATRTFRQHERS